MTVQPEWNALPDPATVALTDVVELALGAVAEPVPTLEGAARWWVVGTRDGLEVHAALGGQLPPVQQLTRVAAGPALLAVRLAVAVSGHRPFTTLFPDPRRPRTLAVVRQGNPSAPTQVERALFGALLRRRPPVAPAPCVRAALPMLRRAADVEGAWTRTLADGSGARLLALLGTAEADVPDGPVLVLGSHHARPEGDVKAGQAMHRVLLTTRTFGLDVAVLAGPAQLADLRAADVPGAGPGLVPQVVLRIGRADVLPAAGTEDTGA